MSKYNGSGTQLQYDTNGAGSFAAISQISSLSGPGQSRDTIDVTTHDTNDWKEFINGLKDAGEVEVGMIFDPEDTAGQKFIMDRFDDGVAKTWRMVFPSVSSRTWSFSAIVTAFEPDPQLEGPLSASATLKLSGAINRNA